MKNWATSKKFATQKLGREKAASSKYYNQPIQHSEQRKMNVSRSWYEHAGSKSTTDVN